MADPDECQSAFEQLSNNNVLSAANIGQAARLAGACPSVAEIDAFAKQTGGGGCNFAAFKSFCDKTMHKEDDKKDIAELFRSTDLADTGKVPVGALKMLQKFGEPLTNAEYDAIIKEFSRPGSDEVDYAALLARIF